MTADTDDTIQFRARICQLIGVQVDDAKLPALAQLLAQRAGANKMSLAQYLDSLQHGAHDEIRNLARELTITETYFMRNPDQFAVLTEFALPERLLADGGNRQLTILSAGCSSGEEPYSIAIKAREQWSQALRRLSIIGFDLNPIALQKANHARYSSWSLRELDDCYRKLWFTFENGMFTLKPEIRKAVHLESRNLTTSDPRFWTEQRFDIVFCRNLLMYFSSEQAQAAVQRMARSMVPGGFLFLGHAETLRGISDDFDLCHSHGTFYYRRRACQPWSGVAAPYQLAEPTQFPWRGVTQTPIPVDDRWVESITAASDRIRSLTQNGAPAAHPQPVNRDQERLDREALLHRAVELSHNGARNAAEQVCDDLLEQDRHNADAHYVLALCREDGQDLVAAIEHDRTAANIDPRFAMPHLHWGLMARRMGESGDARTHLETAAHLFAQEDAVRIDLFGGGFKREALLAMCLAQLATLELLGDRQ
jgi:chemotaxis protein methyltransferase CheR